MTNLGDLTDAELATRRFNQKERFGLLRDGMPLEAIRLLREGYVREVLANPVALRQLRAEFGINTGEAMETTSDRDLIEQGLRTLAPGQCVSVIVGTDELGQRGLHCCTVTAMHGHKTHHAANGQSWRYIPGDERWSDLGPLKDVVHP